MANKPELPPRPPTETSGSDVSDTSPGGGRRPRKDTIHLTPYTDYTSSSQVQQSHPYLSGFDDPRSSSTQSLHPIESAGSDRRTLLIIYLHGFLGDETSFKSFPAHVHHLLSAALAETHVVYSKIYPRYKSRNNISVARDNFSAWLAPHESPTTDVVLVGHSLGGILGAEVILIPSTETGGFRHRILGLVGVDVPFLGMHPGVVGTGIASLFKSTPAEAKESSSTPNASLAEVSDSSTTDPNFNPAYTNDVHLVNRKGKFERGWYFFNKHWGELTKATKSYVTSHLEFGGCLADYPGLKRRYEAVRALEDIDDFPGAHGSVAGGKVKVRFVNYYSASTGRIKERSKSPSPRRGDLLAPISTTDSLESETTASPLTSSIGTPARSISPRLSLEEYSDGGVIQKQFEEDQEISHIESEPIPVEEHHSEAPSDLVPVDSSSKSTQTSTHDPQLPPLPPVLEPPPPFDESQYSDKDTMRVAQREHARQVKQWGRARRDRERTVRDREKLIQKREKQAEKQAEKEAEMQAGKQAEEQIKEQAEQHRGELAVIDSKQEPADVNELSQEVSNLTVGSFDRGSEPEATEPRPARKQKDRKFCVLPNKDPKTGQRDVTWVRIYMEGMDEVVAHTSMFKPSQSYAQLVADTVSRIEGWVKDDATRRAIIALQETD